MTFKIYEEMFIGGSQNAAGDLSKEKVIEGLTQFLLNYIKNKKTFISDFIYRIKDFDLDLKRIKIKKLILSKEFKDALSMTNYNLKNLNGNIFDLIDSNSFSKNLLSLVYEGSDFYSSSSSSMKRLDSVGQAKSNIKKYIDLYNEKISKLSEVEVPEHLKSTFYEIKESLKSIEQIFKFLTKKDLHEAIGKIAAFDLELEQYRNQADKDKSNAFDQKNQEIRVSPGVSIGDILRQNLVKEKPYFLLPFKYQNKFLKNS